MALSTSWDELQSGSLTGTYRWGTSTPADLRAWLGHSDCGGCQPGYAKRQRLTFIGLVPGQSYTLTAGLAYVIGTAYYAAYVVEGQADMLAGQQKVFGAGRPPMTGSSASRRGAQA
ncbi:MAG: hypothetical protein IPG96_19360 [Proteobacteria bacterium]|nr:hypothetical protein [Pseudomonadota bacterium]